MTNYIDQQIDKIAYEMALKELKAIKRLKWFLIGSFVGMLFWFFIFLELYYLAPVR